MTLRGKFLAALTFALLMGLSLLPNTAAAEAFDAGEKKAIETIIRDYLLANPEVLLQSMTEYRRRQEMSEQNQIKEKLVRLSDTLKTNPASPVIGNPDGDVTVVEFFDYRCTYCKKVFPTVQQLLKDDGNIRYVFKEFPILGPLSEVATRASLAMWSIDPGKYMAFHTAMMTSRGQLDQARIFKFAKAAGYNTGDVAAKMKDPAVESEIAANLKLASELDINGTPAFIIGDHIVPGAVDMATLKQLVQAARK